MADMTAGRKNKAAKHGRSHHQDKIGLFKRPWFPYLLTAVTLTAVFLAIMICCRLYPFGDRAMVSSDGINQYLSFYHYFRSVLLTENNIDYTFSNVLGGNFRGLYSYYLASPLYLLFALLPESQSLLALHIIIYLKYLIASLSFCAWAGYQKKENPWVRAALSVSYGFMGYAVSYYSLLSWLDAMALLPLVALGLQRLVKENKSLLYILSLAVTVVANYYTGFMVCAASVLMYIALILTHKGGIGNSLKKTVVPFAASSLLAGALSAWNTVPTALSLPVGRKSELEMHIDFTFDSLFSKLFTGTTNGEQFYNGLPIIFVGIIPVIFVVLFFLNPDIRRRWKAVAAGVLLVMVFSFHNSLLNTIWHCFTKNRMFNYRYSFVCSFFLLAIAWHSVCSWKSLSSRTIGRCFAGCLFAVFLIFSHNYSYTDAKRLYLDLFLLLTGTGLIYLLTKSRRGAAIALFCLMVGNSFANSVLTIHSINTLFDCAHYDAHNQYLDHVRQGLALIPEDDAFYRIEKTDCQTYTDNMALGIPGISNFSSAERLESLDFLWKLGVERHMAWAHYTGKSPAATESLLGVRYVLSEEPLDTDREKYTLVGVTEKNLSVYRNPYALPLIMASGSISNGIFDKEGCDFQNACWRSLAPEINEDVFVPADDLTAQTQRDGSALFTCNAPISGHVCLQFPGAYNEKDWPFTVQILRDGSWESVALTSCSPICLLGEYAQGNVITFRVQPAENQEIGTVMIRIFVQDEDALARYSTYVQNTPMEIRKVTSSHLTVNCQVKEDTPYLVSTIPYDAGWQVTVDGEKVQTMKNWDCMLAFEVNPGEHQIELRYQPPGKTVGMVITMSAVVFILAQRLLSQRSAHRKSKPKRN